jgi:hypothetical protein
MHRLAGVTNSQFGNKTHHTFPCRMTISTSFVHLVYNKVTNFLLRRSIFTACWSVSYYLLASARRATQQVGQCKALNIQAHPDSTIS